MENQLVNVIDPDTQKVGSIPSHQLQEALSQGYTQASQEDVQKFVNKEKFSSVPQQVLTGVEGALKGATAGLFPGFNENAPARAEENPIIHGLTEAGGLAASNFIPGYGEFADVNEAGLAAKTALKAGQITEEVAAPALKAAKEAINPLSAQSVLSGLSERAASAMGIPSTGFVGGAASEGSKLAIQSALFQGDDEISKMISDGPPESMETALTHIGLAGLMGAGLGAVTGGATGLWDAKYGGKLGQFLEDFKGRAQEHLNNPNPVDMLGSELQEHYNNIKSMADDVYGPQGLKAQEIAKLMPEKLDSKILQQATDISDNLKQDIDTMAQKSHRYSARLTQQLHDDLIDYQTALSESDTPGGFFNATQELKQKLQAYSKFDKFIKPSDESYHFVQKVKSLAHSVRTSLEDSEVWGRAAERQQAINKAFIEFKRPLEQFESKFTQEVNNERVIDPGKINTYINQLGKPNAELKQQMLQNFLDASEKYKSVIDKTHQNLGIESPFVPSSLSAAKSSLKELTPGAKLADAFIKKGLTRLTGETAGLAVGATVGHALGSGFLGALIGEHALAPFFSSILPALVKPMLENPANGGAFKSAVNMGLSIVRGENLINKATKNLFKAGEIVLPDHLMPTEKHREKLQKSIETIQTNPNELFKGDSTWAHYLPHQEQAKSQIIMNTANVLGPMKPSTQKQNPLDSEMKTSAAEKYSYERNLDIAQQPLMVLEHIKNGTLIPQDVMTMQKLYPNLYAKLNEKITHQIMDSVDKDVRIPYRMRLGLSLFMDHPLDSTMTAEAIQSTQPMMQPPPQQDQHPKHSMTALNKLPGSYMTPQQSREVSRAK